MKLLLLIYKYKIIIIIGGVIVKLLSLLAVILWARFQQ